MTAHVSLAAGGDLHTIPPMNRCVWVSPDRRPRAPTVVKRAPRRATWPSSAAPAPVVLRQTERLPTAPRSIVTVPRSARFFLREDGGIDTERLDRASRSSGRWSRESAEVAMDPEFPILLHAYRECLLSPSTA